MMLSLMKNEFKKAWYGRKIWIFLIILFGSLLLGTGLTLLADSFAGSVLLGQLFLVLGFTTLAQMINIYVVIQMTGAVAGEFRSGTIKQLLIRPVSRHTLLFAKWFTTLLIGLGLYIAMSLVIYPIHMILFNGDSSLSWGEGFLTTLRFMLYSLPGMTFYFTLALLIATLTRNTAITIVVALIPYFFGGIFTTLNEFFDWPKWIVLTHVDLINIFELQMFSAPFDGLWQSVLFILGHCILFLILGHILFKKRDVI